MKQIRKKYITLNNLIFKKKVNQSYSLISEPSVIYLHLHAVLWDVYI